MQKKEIELKDADVPELGNFIENIFDYGKINDLFPDKTTPEVQVLIKELRFVTRGEKTYIVFKDKHDNQYFTGSHSIVETIKDAIAADLKTPFLTTIAKKISKEGNEYFVMQ